MDFLSLPTELFGQCPVGRIEKTREWIETYGKKPGPCIDIWGDEIESSWRDMKEEYGISASGAVNGWLLLVGPSKGSPPARGDVTPWGFQLCLGRAHPGFLRRDKAFWARMRKLVETFYGQFGLTLEKGLGLTHHANLSTMKSGTQPHKRYLEPGAPGIFEVRKRIRARCVIAYTGDVYDILEKEAQSRYGRQSKYGEFVWPGLKPRAWSVWTPGGEYAFMIARLGNHPSRPGDVVRFSTDIASTAKEQLDCS
jgi:hypothetical protein